jgi:phosphoribosyl 1,2-cyclic phosphodiesterase
MRLKVLGSASSQGIPQPLCSCILCSEASGKDTRLRTSYLLESKSGKNILLDISPDWRQQHLSNRFGFDYLFLSHRHRDHIDGLKDVRMALEAHDKKRTSFQKQRKFLLGKTLDSWLRNGKRDSRWEESVQQAYQQLLSKAFFKRTILTPFKILNSELGLDFIYIRGTHANFYCGGLVISEYGKTIVYLADISQFNGKLIDFLAKLQPNLTIVHLPFFYKSKLKREAAKHSGVENAKNLPGKKILISHFSHRVKLKHEELVKRAKKIDKRFVIAYDNQEIVI